MTFWTVLCRNELVIQLIFFNFFNSLFLILLSGCVKKCWFYSLLFFTMFMKLFLLVRLSHMIASIGLCHRLPNSPHLDCPSLQPLWGMLGPSQRMGSCLIYRNDLCWCLVVPPWHRSLTWILGLKVISMGGSYLVAHLPAPFSLQRRGAVGDSFTDVVQSTSQSPSS